MSLKVNATSSAVNAVPSLHFTPLRSLNVQLRPSGAVVQLSARSGAGARSLPGFVRPSKSTRLMNRDSTKAFGLQGLSVGSAPIGIVTVPPATGPACADGAVDAPGGVVVLVHADTASAATAIIEMARGKTVCRLSFIASSPTSCVARSLGFPSRRWGLDGLFRREHDGHLAFGRFLREALRELRSSPAHQLLVDFR